MRADEFRDYLRLGYRSARTGTGLTARAAKDAVSRCRRVEKTLGLNLDAELQREGVDDVVRRVREATADLGASSVTGLVRVVRLYERFTAARRENAERP